MEPDRLKRDEAGPGHVEAPYRGEPLREPEPARPGARPRDGRP